MRGCQFPGPSVYSTDLLFPTPLQTHQHSTAELFFLRQGEAVVARQQHVQVRSGGRLILRVPLRRPLRAPLESPRPLPQKLAQACRRRLLTTRPRLHQGLCGGSRCCRQSLDLCQR